MNHDLQANAVADAAKAKLDAIISHLHTFMTIGSNLSTTHGIRLLSDFQRKAIHKPLEAVESLHTLETEIVNTLRSIRCDFQNEEIRRNPPKSAEDVVDLFAATPAAEQPTEIKPHNPPLATPVDDDEDETHDTGNPVGEQTPLFTEINPPTVSANLIGKPVPQSDRVGC